MYEKDRHEPIFLGEKYALDLGASVPIEVIPIEFKDTTVLCKYVNSWADRKEELSYDLFELNGYSRQDDIIKAIEEIRKRPKSLETVNLPNGKYYGLWSAYTINVVLPDWEKVDIKMDKGIRGINHKCTVEVIDGWLYVMDR